MVLFYEVHIGDELKATAHLSPLEFGIFALVRSKYIETGPMTEEVMRRWARVISTKEQAAFQAVLQAFFKRRKTRLSCPWFDLERERIHLKSEKARASAANRWNSGDIHATALRSHTGRTTKAMLANLATQPTTPKQPREPTSTHPQEARAIEAKALEVATAMRHAGLASADPGDSLLLRLLAEGATLAEFRAAAETAAKQNKSFEWALARVKGKRADAAAVQTEKPRDQSVEWFDSPQMVQQKGVELGIGPWVQFDSQSGKTEPWPSYRKRVLDRVVQTETQCTESGIGRRSEPSE